MYSMNVSIIDTVLKRINETIIKCNQNIRYELKIYSEFDTNNFVSNEESTDRAFHMLDLLNIENENLDINSN